MPGYFLLRNQQLVGKYCDPTGLGAGYLHDLGQVGDVLVHDGPAWLAAFNWVNNRPRDPTAWAVINLTEQQIKAYKALILLYT